MPTTMTATIAGAGLTSARAQFGAEKPTTASVSATSSAHQRGERTGTRPKEVTRSVSVVGGHADVRNRRLRMNQPTAASAITAKISSLTVPA
jgi:hypothetical protein